MNFEKLAPEREAELKPLSPYGRFEIPTDKEGWRYRLYLETLLSEMLAEQGEKYAYNRFTLDPESNSEGGIGMLHIKGETIVGCKLYWYDGTLIGTPCGQKKGLSFRDHEDKGIWTVHQIFLLSDAFAEFLKAKKIPFCLYSRNREGREETLRGAMV